MAEIHGTTGNDVLDGTAADDTIFGDAGDDTLSGLDGDDHLLGEDGDDQLKAGAGDDMLDGGAGDDTLTIGPGDSADGGAGFDELRITFAAQAPITFDTAGIISGSPFVLSGGTIENCEAVGYIRGSANDDRITIATQPSRATIDGGDGHDLLTASGSAVTFNGGAGYDTLISGAAADVFDGGADFDTVYYLNSPVGLDFTAAAPSETWIGAGGDELTSIERIRGSQFADTLDVGSGTGSVDLWGEGGNDTLIGGAGRDFLVGGEGDDTVVIADTDTLGEMLSGNEGFDTIELHSPAAPGTQAFYSIRNMPAFQFEHLRFVSDAGSTVGATASFSQIVDQTGGGQLTHLTGGAGTDSLSMSIELALPGAYSMPAFTLSDWSADDYLYLYLFAPSPGGTFTLNARDGLPGQQVLQASSGNDTLNGSSGVDYLLGNLGNDVLSGLGGADTLSGGAGTDRDRFDGGDGVDTVAYGTSDAGVIVRLDSAGPQNTRGAGNDTLLNIENLGGSGFDDKLIGNGSANTLSGGSSNDVLNGLAGDDSMSGGTGDDVYHVDAAGDVVVEDAAAGDDKVTTAVDWTLGDNLENLSLASAARAGTGNALANIIYGSGGADILSGLDADDILRGKDGRDTLQGGDGADLIDGGVGKDVLTGGAGRDVFQFRDGDFGATRPLADEITDFSQADGEKMQLHLVDADTTVADDQAFTWISTGGFTGVAGQLHHAHQGGNTYVEGDTNGDGNADFTIMLTGTLTLTSADFTL